MEGISGHLILSRKQGESIVIGDGIIITVVELRNRGRSVVRLGITAPKGVPVHRQEVYDAIQRGESKPKPQDPQEQPQ